jgi:hypothetical protein
LALDDLGRLAVHRRLDVVEQLPLLGSYQSPMTARGGLNPKGVPNYSRCRGLMAAAVVGKFKR